MPALVLAVLLAGCSAWTRPAKAPIVPPTDPMYAQVDATVAAWRADASLPSIATAHCERVIESIRIRVETPAQFETHALCPVVDSGRCDPACRAGMCAAATWQDFGIYRRRRAEVYLAEAVVADGEHERGIAVETSRILASCSGGRRARGWHWAHAYSNRYSELDPRVWGPDGVIRRSLRR